MMTPELEALVTKFYSEGTASFGDLGLATDAFAKRITAIVNKRLGPSPSDEAVLAFVAGLHGRDLYLATACAQYSPANTAKSSQGEQEQSSIPWKAFEKTYKTYIRSLARFFHRESFLAEDLADNMLADLFLPDRSGASRIASYDGGSALSTWLRVILCNRFINARRNSSTSQSKQLQTDIPDQPALNNIESAVRTQRYGPVLEDALLSACRNLTPRERLVLLWRYEQGLRLGTIARLLGIHQSNVTRQLERMQKKLRDEVVTFLSTKHGLTPPAIQEYLEDIVTNPGHNMSILEFIRRGREATPGKLQ